MEARSLHDAGRVGEAVAFVAEEGVEEGVNEQRDAREDVDLEVDAPELPAPPRT